MPEALLEYFMYNQKIHKVSEFESIYSDKYPSIYEVIRIIDKIPIFLEEHYERLKNSAAIIDSSINYSFDHIKNSIKEMIDINHITNYNIKVVINDLSSTVQNEYYFFIKSSYPSGDMYKNGVKTFLYKAVRNNPNAKIINTSLRDEVDRLIREKECYEAILVNDRDEITEGSRSNIFFIKNNCVFTAPSKDVLLGITRQRIISLCLKNNIEVIETPITLNEIKSYDAVFMSGTSPKVLPISRIDGIPFSTDNKLLLNIMKIYNDEIEKYITKYR